MRVDRIGLDAEHMRIAGIAKAFNGAVALDLVRGWSAVTVAQMLGHTGNFPGYVEFAAVTADGKRAVTTTLNMPAPTGRLLARVRDVQTTAVCALLGGS